MELKAGYKKTEAGVIPAGWQVCGITDICSDIFLGLTTKVDYVKSGGVPLVRAKDINSGRLLFDDTLQISKRQHQELTKYRRANKGDVLVSKSGTLGICALVDTDTEFSIYESIIVMKSNTATCDSRFLLWLMRFEATQDRLLEETVGSTVGHLNLLNFRKLVVPIPKMEEQKAIAAALSDVDSLITALDRLIAKKRDIKQAAMQELLTGKRRLPGFSISSEWVVKLLDDLFDFSGGFSASRDQLSTEGHCYLHYGDIHMSKKTFIDVRSEQQDIPKLDIPLKRVSPVSLLGDGDVVFVDASEDEEGTSKHVVIINKEKIPFISGLHTIIAKSKTSELDHQYLRYCFQTADIKRQFRFFAVGTKVLGISKTNIARVMLRIPSLLEQNAIAAILSDMDAEIAVLEARREKTRALKQGMMQELLTGRIRLT